MTTDTGMPRSRLGVVPVTALAAAPILVLFGLDPDHWYPVPLGLLVVALLAAATWTVHRLRSNLEDEIEQRRTIAVRLGDTNTRRLYKALVAMAYLVLAGLSLLDMRTGLALATLVLVPTPGWQVGSGAVSHLLDPVVRDTALITCLTAGLMGFGLLAFSP